VAFVLLRHRLDYLACRFLLLQECQHLPISLVHALPRPSSRQGGSALIRMAVLPRIEA
jgi:hypothetical protein